MAKICEFGTAPEQKAAGFKGIGVVAGTDTEVLSQFFADNVRLVRSAECTGGGQEFFVMVGPE